MASDNAVGSVSTVKLAEIAREGNFSRVKNVYDTNPDIFNVRDEAGRLPFHWAVSGGHLELADYLFQKLKPDCGVDIEDDMGWTPLMIASSAGHGDLVKFLLNNSADVNHCNTNGQAPLHYAASKNHTEIGRMLLGRGASVNAQDCYGSSALHRAASKGNLKSVQLLLSVPRCQINIFDGERNTPLHLACDEKRTDVAVLLVKSGAHLDPLNKEEKSPLDYVEPALRKTLQRLAETG